MITKTPAKKGGTTKVTFELPAEYAGEQVCLCGEFNSWAPDATHISFARGSTLWSGQVNGSASPIRGGPCEIANAALDDFMGARERGRTRSSSCREIGQILRKPREEDNKNHLASPSICPILGV